MKRSRLHIILGLMIAMISGSAMSQCFIKSTDQSSGYITYYLDPELVAQTPEMGVAFSVQMVGEKYYLAVTYQFAGKAQPVEEKIALKLQNGYTLELDMYTMEVANAGGVELCMAVFNLEDVHMPYFLKSQLNAVEYKTMDGKKYSLPITSSKDVLVRQLKCFGK